MHVNDNTISSASFDLGPINNENRPDQVPGNLNSRSAIKLDGLDSNSKVIRLASTINSQASKITEGASHQDENQVSNQPVLINLSIIKSSQIQSIRSLSNIEEQEILSALASLPPHETKAIVEERDGKVILKKLTEEAFENLSIADAQSAITFFEDKSGNILVFDSKDKPLNIQEFQDENGQSKSFEVVQGSEEFHAQLDALHANFISQFIAARSSTKQKEPEEEKTQETDRHAHVSSHYRPQLKSSLPPTSFEPTNKPEDLLRAHLRLGENPRAIAKQIIEAEIALEIKKEKQEKMQKEKERRIDEQEERRELRLEGYKKDEVTKIQHQHEILNERINDQKRGRPPTPPTDLKTQD